MQYQPLSVEFMFSPGCRCARAALHLLRQVLAEEHCQPRLTIRVVTSDEDAIRYRCFGSPTILIDGVDIEGPSAQRHGFRVSCRTYQPHGEYPGVPSADAIRQAIHVHPGKRRQAIPPTAPSTGSADQFGAASRADCRPADSGRKV